MTETSDSDQLLFIPESRFMSVVFHVVAVVSMFTVCSFLQLFLCPFHSKTFQISILGLSMNVYLFNKFATKAGKASAFHKLCLVKTIPNSIVCASFLFWVVPLSLLQPDYERVPRIANVFVGQIAGFGAYVTGMSHFTLFWLAIDERVRRSLAKNFLRSAKNNKPVN